jgi:hypothetical protein
MASSTTTQKPMTEQPLMRVLSKASTFFLQILFAAFVFLYNATCWCAQRLIPAPALVTSSKLHAEWAAQTGRDLARLINERVSAEEQNRRNEIAQLRNRYESEIDALREEMASLKSSVITLRRAL